LLDVTDFIEALRSGAYKNAVNEANDYAYELSGVWAVPAYRIEGRKLDSIEGVGITKAQLDSFISRKI
jgi:hypothetical protein